MKKLLLSKKLIIIMLLVGLSSAGWAQALLYEAFDYATPAYIGGNGDAGSTSNNWTTHNVTAGQTTTIDIENGNLTYTGLKSSVGNKVYLFSNANAVSRDVNRGFTSSATAVYYSALINLVDGSQINLLDNYFMHLGMTQGATNTSFGARLGARAVGSPVTNFRFILGNNSGGTPVYSDNGADLNFGTTYLVVVKYDISVTPNVATMWINPTSLGGAEPAGGITNSTGTNTYTNFTTGSICLRNNATTPKAYIDEIRVGNAWADVTPIGGVGVSKNEKSLTSIYPNPATSYFNVKAPEGNYLVSVCNSIGSIVKSTSINGNDKVEISDLNPGLYFVTIENIWTNQKEVHKLMIK